MKRPGKLTLKHETVRNLAAFELKLAAGGVVPNSNAESCGGPGSQCIVCTSPPTYVTC